jgi:hypothetical protein
MTRDIPLCVGLSALFESTHLADHYRARALCDVCPAIAWCKTQVPPSNQLPVGTWAGRLYGLSSRHRAAS